MKEWMFTYKDGTQTLLDLPHTWNALDGQDGGDDYFKGTCTYEKTVKKPEFSVDERVYLQFHGVNASAKVIFNGETVCVRDGGIYRDVEFLIVSKEHFDLDHFSLVDKLVSSLSATVVGVAVSMIGLENLPTAETAYSAGMNWVVIILFCIIPMVAWAITLLVMKGYTLTGPRMKEIQAINAVRKEGIAKGMTLEEAMEKWQTIQDIE
jgi:hypothetical protein